MDHNRRHEPLMLCERYADDPARYPKYDNYAAINVDSVRHIPEDYDGVMGVPITFLDKYCPEQFEILGITKPWADGRTKIYPNQTQVSKSGKTSIVSKLNDAAALLLSGPSVDTHYVVDGACYRSLYARILIRHRRD